MSKIDPQNERKSIFNPEQEVIVWTLYGGTFLVRDKDQRRRVLTGITFPNITVASIMASKLNDDLK